MGIVGGVAEKENITFGKRAQAHMAELWVFPYKHSISGPPEGPEKASHPVEASHPSATGWHKGGPQGSPPEGLIRPAFSEPIILSPEAPLGLLSFCFTSSGLQQLT